MNKKIEMSIKNEIPEIKKVCESVAKFGNSNNLPQKIIFSLHLALDEILTNIISYGYEDKKEHKIDIRLSLHQGKLLLEIEDDSKPFNPSNAPTPDVKKPLEERKIGGLGIYLVKNLMDDLEYKTHNGKNLLILRKRI
ncbi:MAG: ATP-binding protein [Candidatus Marinimicrobia bacterium]|jgi:anti-sigma regulatory factor (Ser/Thr protein kinase)|nr:ATP-binding protein [Candidatus Neomarinimicrobiota bacterium]